MLDDYMDDQTDQESINRPDRRLIVLIVLIGARPIRNDKPIRKHWTAATVAGTLGLQRVDAAPELVATREDARPQVVLDRAQSPLRVAAR